MEKMRVWMISRKRCRMILWLFGCGLLLVGASGRYEPASPVLSYVTAGTVIAVVAGHGGPDAGAVSADGVQEKEVSLQNANRLTEELTPLGCIVIPVRETDTDLAGEDFSGTVHERKQTDLRARADLANRNRAALYVSVHLNADPSPKWSGAQTFYERDDAFGERIGVSIQNQLKAELGNTRREALAADGYYLMNATDMPTVIVEAGFLSNPKEAALLQDGLYQQKIAAAIARGIVDGIIEETQGSAREETEKEKEK